MYKASLVMKKQRPVQASGDECTCGCHHQQANQSDNPNNICYHFVDQPSVKSQSIVVGGRRVPYFAHQRAHLKQSRSMQLVCLSPIREDTFDCEHCHSTVFSTDHTTKHVALHRSRSTHRLHHDLGLC
ncbi:Aste57867_21433 [Aphanomyces stellatus]|uniref:Aste57867_21433 protein n=1 Tax=Aphanomyces stellatus TaxID=120398 RepID=A0A485LIX3_9STRA|nr:hypothetical protein As57867_021364 [Aphanomyces stellatus]VFT98104.1 Aste57867_21433 [Aphanomyces stellatus]